VTAEEIVQRAESDSEEEQIFVTRQEEQRDPEADAEFDRAFEKMMAESIESRKNDRKSMFDVPLPMRRAQRETAAVAEDSGGEGSNTPPPSNTMAFSLMTKKGNRQQVSSWSIGQLQLNTTLPSLICFLY